MRILLYPFMLLSALGFALSVGIHLAAIAGLPIPGGRAVWGLHVGIFIVWLPTVLVANRIGRHGKRSDFWKLALSGCPPWARYALYGLFGYAVMNFVYGTVISAGHQKPVGAEELDPQIRLFSGHWMVFYGAAFATLYSAINSPHLLTNNKCANGHDVGPLDEFCPKCGATLGQGRTKA